MNSPLCAQEAHSTQEKKGFSLLSFFSPRDSKNKKSVLLKGKPDTQPLKNQFTLFQSFPSNPGNNVLNLSHSTMLSEKLLLGQGNKGKTAWKIHSGQ